MRWVLLVEDDHLVGQALRRRIERGAGLRVRCARAPAMVWEALPEALAEAFHAHGSASEPVPCFWKPDGVGALVAWLRELSGGGRDPPVV